MAAATSLHKANQLLMSRPRRQSIFNGQFCCNRSAIFGAISTKFVCVKIKSAMNSSSSSEINTTTTNFEKALSQFKKQSSSSKGISVDNSILRRLMKYSAAAIVTMLCLMMHRRQSAFASPGGARTNNRRAAQLIVDFREGEYAWTFFSILLLNLYFDYHDITKRTRIVKLQVGVSVSEEGDLQGDLDRIAKTVDTSSSKRSTYILRGTIDSLLRHSNDWIFGYSFVDVGFVDDVDASEKDFAQLSNDRGKFNKETIVHFNNLKNESKTSPGDTYMVATVLVAIHGLIVRPHLPTITDRAYLETTLRGLRSVSYYRLRAVDVFWTLEKESEGTSKELGSISWISMIWYHCRHQTDLWYQFRFKPRRDRFFGDEDEVQDGFLLKNNAN